MERNVLVRLRQAVSQNKSAKIATLVCFPIESPSFESGSPANCQRTTHSLVAVRLRERRFAPCNTTAGASQPRKIFRISTHMPPRRDRASMAKQFRKSYKLVIGAVPIH